MSAWSSWLSSLSANDVDDIPAIGVEELRRQALAMLSDCAGAQCDRVRNRLQTARTAHDLWLARSEIFQLVAHQHCQSQAVARINELLPAFEGWVPRDLLVRL
ncbi:MAG: hypothetical protein HY854_13825 [Burkholderiales bacterium]|nr:hypothetical protein [Burkholderiales bacterium]